MSAKEISDRRLDWAWMVAIVGLSVFFIWALIIQRQENEQVPPLDNPTALSAHAQLTYSTATCLIKGNISYSSGYKIYQVPGGQYYATTNIDPTSGERWFCTEQDALNNGWRKIEA